MVLQQATADDWFRTRRDDTRGAEALQAGLSRHAYGRHAHATYAVGFTERGSQSFWCRGARHRTQPGSVILFSPFDLHDGHATTDAGVVYRMLYLAPEPLSAALAELGPRHEIGFRDVVAEDPPLAAALFAYAHELDAGDDPFAAGERYLGLAAALMRHAGRRGRAEDAGHGAIARLAARMREEMAERLTIEALAEGEGLGRFQLIRAFRRRFGLPPSEYLRAIRLEAAKGALARGVAPAEAAAEAGFTDQAHLTRLFKRAYGLTPAAYARQAGVPRLPRRT